MALLVKLFLAAVLSAQLALAFPALSSVDVRRTAGALSFSSH
jgi:hypothetical protein